MRNLFILIILLFSCKKDDITVKEEPQSAYTYTPTHIQDTILFEYEIKTNVAWYVINYNSFEGFDSLGEPIFSSVTDTVTIGDKTISFNVISSPFGKKYNYQLFLQSNTTDSNTLSININGNEVIYRPNYNQSFNFVNYSL